MGEGRRYRFGVFEADAGTGELWRKGVRVRVHAQPFAVLCLLLERPGEVLTREQISRELWPEGTFVDYEHGVNSAVNRLREALGDRAASPRYVETLARRGYRFVAPVERVGAVAAEKLANGEMRVSHAESERWNGAAAPTLAGEKTAGEDGAPGFGEDGAPGFGEDGAPGFGEDGAPGFGGDGAPGFGGDGAPGFGGGRAPASVNGKAGLAQSPVGWAERLLARPEDLPVVSAGLVRVLFALLQAMYLSFYVGALANLGEVRELVGFLPGSDLVFAVVVGSAALLIPVRVFLVCAVLFRAPGFQGRFLRLWWGLLGADVVWAVSPFLLLHHISFGLALACVAVLVYSPFAQRSLVLMGAAEGRAA